METMIDLYDPPHSSFSDMLDHHSGKEMSSHRDPAQPKYWYMCAYPHAHQTHTTETKISQTETKISQTTLTPPHVNCPFWLVISQPTNWFMTYWLVGAHFGNTVCSIGFLTQCQKNAKWMHGLLTKNRFIFFTTVFVNYSFLCSLNKKNPCKMLDKTNNYQEYVKPSLLFQGNHSLLSVYRFHFIQNYIKSAQFFPSPSLSMAS